MEKRGRPRGFDRQDALRRAMVTFWQKGFEGSSMTDLTDAMGIASPSLYAAFGSKEALFQEALALYQESVGKEIWDPLDCELAITDAIAAFLNNSVTAYAPGKHPRGCLIVLGAGAGEGSSTVHEELRRRRADNLTRLRERFARAVADGELSPDFDCHAAAAFYATLQHGMSIMARDGADAATMCAIADGGIRALEGPAFNAH